MQTHLTQARTNVVVYQRIEHNPMNKILEMPRINSDHDTHINRSQGGEIKF